jgi:hypothetical protein
MSQVQRVALAMNLRNVLSHLSEMTALFGPLAICFFFLSLYNLDILFVQSN